MLSASSFEAFKSEYGYILDIGLAASYTIGCAGTCIFICYYPLPVLLGRVFGTTPTLQTVLFYCCQLPISDNMPTPVWFMGNVYEVLRFLRQGFSDCGLMALDSM
jgi:hypothetical protein